MIVLSLFLIFGQIQPGCSCKADKVCSRVLGVVNSPMKNEKSRQILPKSRNLAQPSNGSRSFRFCVSRSHICFSIKSLKFSVSVSDFKIPVSASRRVSDFPFATPCIDPPTERGGSLSHHCTCKARKANECERTTEESLYLVSKCLLNNV